MSRSPPSGRRSRRNCGGIAGCFGQDRTAGHFDTYCRGLLSDLPRKSVEPIALAAGTAVRTLQEFLVTAAWDHDRRAGPPPAAGGRRPGRTAARPARHGRGDRRDELRQEGGQDAGRAAAVPGVRGQDRQRGRDRPRGGGRRGGSRPCSTPTCTCPQSWAADRERCREAGIPDDVRYRPKWRIALDQLMRLDANGVRSTG